MEGFELALDNFEKNSVHLNAAGYEFAMARLKEGAVEGYPKCMMPLWVNHDESTDDYIVAILGSEPKINENEKINIKLKKVEQLISIKGFPWTR